MSDTRTPRTDAAVAKRLKCPNPAKYDVFATDMDELERELSAANARVLELSNHITGTLMPELDAERKARENEEARSRKMVNAATFATERAESVEAHVKELEQYAEEMCNALGANSWARQGYEQYKSALAKKEPL